MAVTYGKSRDRKTGMQPVHDDRLISAALTAEADRLLTQGKINLGHALSAIIRPSDPLQNLSF